MVRQRSPTISKWFMARSFSRLCRGRSFLVGIACLLLCACGGRLVDLDAGVVPQEAAAENQNACEGLEFASCYSAGCIWILRDMCDEYPDANLPVPISEVVRLPSDGCYPRWANCEQGQQCDPGTRCRYVASGSGCAPPETPSMCLQDDYGNPGEACRAAELCVPP